MNLVQGLFIRANGIQTSQIDESFPKSIESYKQST